MKQNERRYEERICVNCYPTLKEKLRILLAKGFEVDVDLSVSSENGVLNSYCNIKTFKSN